MKRGNKKTKKRLSKSTRKYIRRQKELIRRTIFDLETKEEKIKELTEKFKK